jgi:hypothetical protein
MSASQLSAVLVNALVDERFCRNLLETPHTALSRFDLSPDERHALSSFRADTIEEFAAEMVDWLSASQPVQQSVMTATSFASL